MLCKLKRLEKSILNKVEEVAGFPLMRIDKGFLCSQSRTNKLKEIIEGVIKDRLGLLAVVQNN